jgi:hypothetical protein
VVFIFKAFSVWGSSSLNLLGVEVFILKAYSARDSSSSSLLRQRFSVSSHERRAKDFTFRSCWSSDMLP